MKISQEAQRLMAENEVLLHAIQSGVAMEMEHGGRDTEPKHLRVGINNALCEASAMGRLLIGKGIITDVEYFTAINDVLSDEKERYEQQLTRRMGVEIKLA